jgi:hypothetical protein
MVQAFRREENEQATQTLRLRGLDPAGTYEISNFDTKSTESVSGKELMQEGLLVDIPTKRGASVIIYKKVQ